MPANDFEDALRHELQKARHNPVDPQEILDFLERSPIRSLHLAIIGLCACGFAIDLLELALGGAFSAVFAAPPYHLDPKELSWVVTSVYFGAIAGAPILGWVADKIGPKKVLTGVILWLGLTSLLGAASVTPSQLALSRLVSGIGLGAYPPLMIAYLADISPVRRRGAIIFTTCAIAYLAPPAAIFAVRWLTPIAPLGLEGWRWPLAVAGAIAMIATFGFAWAPEAPHWLASAGRPQALRDLHRRFAGSRAVDRTDRPEAPAPIHPMGGPVRAPAPSRSVRQVSPRMRLLILSLISFSIPVATVSFPLVTGPILLARHFSLSDTLFYVGLATFGPFIGTLASGLFVDRVGRRTFMVACAAGMLGSVGMFFLADGAAVMAVGLIGFALFTALYLPAMTMYGAELFAPAVRGRATSMAWVANRVAAAGAPVILIPLVQGGGTSTIGIVLAAALVANILIVMVAAPREGIGPMDRVEI